VLEFIVWHDGNEWIVSVDEEILGTGSTPVSAMIAAEVAVYKRLRGVK
jgi:hypothetical protein